jgi:LAO/AO transport system kinase
MDRHHKFKSALKVNEGIEQPEQVNSDAVNRLKASRKEILSPQQYVEGILKGDIVMLSKAITLIESALPEHQLTAQTIISSCLPKSGKAIRVGITGVPGAGKSTFIEALGMFLIKRGNKVAVLAIDPSSQRSKGSILGDKTRMERLSIQANAYIRPSAASGTLGGVARKTHETIILCEAAGFDTIIVETVGVGQSETAVHSMVDFFLLLLISGAGDELQGIKRGIMEMADGIAVNKADGDNITKASRAKAECENALHLFPLSESGVSPKVTTCSSTEILNIDTVWQMVTDYIASTRENGYFDKKRVLQAVQIMYNTINEQLSAHFYQNKNIQQSIPFVEAAIRSNNMTSYMAATKLLEKYFDALKINPVN